MTRTKALLGLSCGVLLLVGAGLGWRMAEPAPTAATAGLRKCTVGGRLLYTNGDCPAGSRERALTGGAVTVLDLPRNPAPAASSASGVPNVRQWLIDPQAVDIQDKRMEAVIGR